VIVTEEKIDVIRKMEMPDTAEALRSFLGLINYMGSQAVPHYCALAKPLWEMLSGSSLNAKTLTWTSDGKRSFEMLKKELINMQTRDNFDVTKPVVVQTDACALGLGAVLLQDGKPVIFASRTLTMVESRYSQIEREFLGIVFALF